MNCEDGDVRMYVSGEVVKGDGGLRIEGGIETIYFQKYTVTYRIPQTPENIKRWNAKVYFKLTGRLAYEPPGGVPWAHDFGWGCGPNLSLSRDNKPIFRFNQHFIKKWGQIEEDYYTLSLGSALLINEPPYPPINRPNHCCYSACSHYYGNSSALWSEHWFPLPEASYPECKEHNQNLPGAPSTVLTYDIESTNNLTPALVTVEGCDAILCGKIENVKPCSPPPSGGGERVRRNICSAEYANVCVVAFLMNYPSTYNPSQPPATTPMHIAVFRGVQKAWKPDEEYFLQEVDRDAEYGLHFLPNGKLILTYTVDQQSYYRVNTKMGERDGWGEQQALDPDTTALSLGTGIARRKAFKVRTT